MENIALGAGSTNYIVKVVTTVEEGCHLLHVSFEYVN
jgi:hypothetical protein